MIQVNKMPTRFLLDLSVLDDRFTGSPLYVGIDAEQIAFVDTDLPKYKFFQENVSIDQILLVSKHLDLAPRQEDFRGYPALFYTKAALYFFQDPPLRVGLGSTVSNRQVKEQKLWSYDAWYADGKYLKGDAETFKKNGILILGGK